MFQVKILGLALDVMLAAYTEKTVHRKDRALKITCTEKYVH